MAKRRLDQLWVVECKVDAGWVPMPGCVHDTRAEANRERGWYLWRHRGERLGKYRVVPYVREER